MTLMNLRTLCDVFPVPVGKWKQYRMAGLVKQNKIKQSFVWKIKARKKSENCIIYIFQEIVEYYFVFLDSFSLVVYLNLCTKEFLSYREMIQFQSQTEWQSNIFSRLMLNLFLDRWYKIFILSYAQVLHYVEPKNLHPCVKWLVH